jgi:DNA-binding IclR family transcriptional regulator
MAPRTSGTVTKAIDILDLFLDGEGGLTVTQIAANTGIHKSTVVRLCATLEGRGYLRRDSRGVFCVGAKVESLASVYRAQFQLEDIIRPVLCRLRDETGESASFYAMENDERVCQFRENARHAIRHVVDEGARFSFKEGVVGRVLLAYSGTRGRLYDQIRLDGHFNAEGREPFTASVSTPLLSRSGHLVGALVVSGLSSRFSSEIRDRAILLLKEAGEELQEILPG